MRPVIEKLRILKINPRYRGGGAERSARDLAQAMIAKGHEVQMWTACPEKDTPDWVKPIRSLTERFLYPINYIDPVADWRHISARRLVDSVTRDDFDIIHLHNIHGHWMSIKAVQRLCERMPVVWSLRDGWAAYGGVPYDLDEVREALKQHNISYQSSAHFPLYTSTSQARKWASFLRKWMPQPSKLLCPSRWVEVAALDGGYFNNPQTILIPNGVTMTSRVNDLPEQMTARQQLGIDERHKVILLIAANLQSPFKGMDLGIDALNRYAQAGGHDTTIILLGLNAEKIQEKLSGFNNIIASYADSTEALIQAYVASDMTLIPSIAEQFGLVAAESLLCKTPIICFDVGGISEIAGENERGFKIQPFDTHQMTIRITELLDNKALGAQMGDSGQQWVLENCLYDDHVNRTIDIYREVLA